MTSTCSCSDPPTTAPPVRAVCQRCREILVDQLPTVVAISRPGEPAETWEICSQCEPLLRHHLRGRGRHPAPLRSRVAVRVPAAGPVGRASRFESLFSEAKS
jgi:hypothetical protein